jgi:hypothetical protein
MSLKVVAASLSVALTLSPAAYASSLTNRDDKDHKVAVIEGKATETSVLKPSAALQRICPKGCVIRLDDDGNNEYELSGSEDVSIEGGYLYYDGPPATAVPKAGGAAAPSAPGAK